jgi:hypothetical protein
VNHLQAVLMDVHLIERISVSTFTFPHSALGIPYLINTQNSLWIISGVMVSTDSADKQP